VIVIEQVPPAEMDVSQVFDETADRPSVLTPEEVGVTANEFGFLNVVVSPVLVTTVNVSATGADSVRLMDCDAALPAFGVTVSEPVTVPAAVVVTVTLPQVECAEHAEVGPAMLTPLGPL